MRSAGTLDQIIEIHRLSITKSTYGDENRTYTLNRITRARHQHKSGARLVENNEVVNDYTETFTVRSYVDVNELDQIIWKNRKYRILDIEKDDKHTYIKINAQLINE